MSECAVNKEEERHVCIMIIISVIDLDLPLCTCGHQERGSVRGWVEGTLRTPRTRVEPTTETLHLSLIHI